MIARTLGWIAIVLSVITLLVFGSLRMADMAQDPDPADPFGIRYVQHPWISLLHIVPGLIFLTLAPLQFVSRIRQRHIRFHRALGRFLVSCALLSGLFALVACFRLPAFGGVSTQAATIFFGVIFLFSLVKAVRHISRGEIRPHREWMIRAYALAMGAASIRVCIGLFAAFSALRVEEVFGTSFWLGFGVNLVVAEVWIHLTRPRLTQAGARLA